MGLPLTPLSMRTHDGYPGGWQFTTTATTQRVSTTDGNVAGTTESGYQWCKLSWLPEVRPVAHAVANALKAPQCVWPPCQKTSNIGVCLVLWSSRETSTLWVLLVTKTTDVAHGRFGLG
mmetsp:Transcript_25109/g.64149  ORF Transcript_25109/g.64149 Transcript_25109/m.64149 type:complete len:119 (+) Transcript_25109:172-528(+)